MSVSNDREEAPGGAADREQGAAGQPLLSLSDVEKSFPGVKALRGVRFDLRAGEVHALMGENGAGKSTLMKIITGVYQPDSGEMRVSGEPVSVPDPRAAQALGIGIIHQELFLMNHLTAAQNIFIGREPRKGFGLFVDEQQMRADADALFRRMKVDIDPDVEVGTLTVARQQLVEIAKALSFNSRVLIMDEPTSALNETEVEHLFAIIEDLKRQGVGIVYITHKMDEVKRIADRVTVMRDGQYIDTLPAATTDMATIISLMVGRELADSTRAEGRGAEEEVLRVEGLNRGQVIRNVSFSLRRGEILGFAGLMGAGRTEVARAIFGADPIDSGEITIHGRRQAISSPKDAVALGLAYLSEDRKHFGLVTGMSVSDNITMASWRRFTKGRVFMDDARLREASKDYVARLKVKTPSVFQETRLLSGGNQQKVVIAKWLLRDCDILIFDEPTRGIDIGAKAEIYKLLQGLAAQGKSIIVISSELPEVLRLSHRILVMCEGRITGELDGREATQESIMHLATLRPSIAAE
ncbi:sugar ABC transporter ATP-binding protein [Gellertiella hungarica]|uniref:Ribose transport system ATP-binding protein n=1 Tax=Gellertiella hungarica TaxID=1572859 RepID=A0A7W6J6E4_9HYPH|nr:sugar ABC transporter ATP-binding protein [Gellertiella hungarica]MBB4065638.1 ribose transport system ATP-binding protein [Gellertiella hungarica]